MWERVRPWVFPVWCLGCGAPNVALCADCVPASADRVSDVVAGVGVVAAGAYAGLLRRAIVAMKHGERSYLEPLAGVLAGLVAPEVPLVPLPTSRRRSAARGFDQAVELARRVAARHGGRCCELLVNGGAAQRGRSRRSRLEAGGRFAVRATVALPEMAIVVDDVCTTGATLGDGIATLRAAGIAVLGAVVLARTASGRNSWD